MISVEKLLFTGGSGLLGTEVKELIPSAYFPTHKEFDVTDYNKMSEYLKEKEIDTVVHAAAFTSPPLIDKNPLEAINTNIIGTSNLVKLCSEKELKLVYISTDYVFKGDKGNYKEEDNLNPVNKYAWSKLGGECAVKMHNNSLIIRTSFGPTEFPFEKAFIDQWTSRESVSEIAKKIVKVLNENIWGTIHLGGNRRTVFEYAKELGSSKEIGELSINDVSFNVPIDTSLDCKKYSELMGDKE